MATVRELIECTICILDLCSQHTVAVWRHLPVKAQKEKLNEVEELAVSYVSVLRLANSSSSSKMFFFWTTKCCFCAEPRGKTELEH